MGALRSGTFSSQDPVEASLVRMCETLLDDGDVDDPTFDVLEEAVGAEQVLELIVLVGYYRTLAQMMRVFRVGTPDA
jgi:4-carboxymuconolactone decarboxylase